MQATGPMRRILRYCLLTAALACCGFAAAAGGRAMAASVFAPAGMERIGSTLLATVNGGAERDRAARRHRSRTKPGLKDAPSRHSPNVTLRAVLAGGGRPVREGLSWRVFEAHRGARGAKKLIWSGGGAEPKILLKPGRYRVEAEYGLARKSAVIRVRRNKPLSTTLVLNAGTIRVRGVAVQGGPLLGDMSFALRSASAGADAAELSRSTLSEAVFHVPAGTYTLRAEHGLASTEISVSVKAGREKAAEVVMNTGVLTLSAHARREGAPLSGVTFTVHDDSESGGGREVARSVRDEPRFGLPAGRYRVTAVLGLARNERKVEIAAGKETAESFVLGAGGVRMFSILAGRRQPLDHDLVYKVYSLSHDGAGAGRPLVTTTSAAPTLFLERGKYRIECQYGWHNARQFREVEVKAGETIEAGFEHLAAGVTLKLVSRAGGKPLAPVKWTLKYSGGGTVLISQDDSPALILQAGRYQAMAQHEKKTYSRAFEASANSEQTVELIAE